MGRIFFAGDTHGHFDHIIQAVRQHRPAAVVFLGDLQPQRPLDQELQPILDLTEIWWIHGNHDTDSDADHDHLFGSALADRNLHGRVIEIAGVRIAGLGGIFRGQVWMPPGEIQHETPEAYTARCGKGNRWRSGLPRKHRSSIFPTDYARLVGERAEILVTHEAPSSHPHGFDAIDELARSLGAAGLFHGHHHDRLDYSAHRERLGFEAFGVGFCGITDQDGRVIVAGEFDEQRQNRQEGVEMNEEWDKKAMDLRTEMEAHKSLSKPASGDWIEVMDTATGASCWYPVELYDQLRIAELRRRGIDP